MEMALMILRLLIKLSFRNDSDINSRHVATKKVGQQGNDFFNSLLKSECLIIKVSLKPLNFSVISIFYLLLIIVFTFHHLVSFFFVMVLMNEATSWQNNNYNRIVWININK